MNQYFDFLISTKTNYCVIQNKKIAYACKYTIAITIIRVQRLS